MNEQQRRVQQAGEAGRVPAPTTPLPQQFHAVMHDEKLWGPFNTRGAAEDWIGERSIAHTQCKLVSIYAPIGASTPGQECGTVLAI